MPKNFKKVDRKLFMDTFNDFVAGKIRLSVAAKKIGLSIPTVTTRFDMMLKEKRVRDEWFFDDGKDSKGV